MFSRVVTIAAVAMLALALVGGSAYILLNRASGEQAHLAYAETSGAGYRGGQEGVQGTGNRAGTGQPGGGRGRFAAPSARLSGRGQGQGAASEGANPTGDLDDGHQYRGGAEWRQPDRADR